MARWTIDAPTSLDFDEVSGLRVRLIGGSVAVLATDGTPSLDVANISGDPLEVSYEDGVLTISHENLTWEAAEVAAAATACRDRDGHRSAQVPDAGRRGQERLDAHAVSGDVTADVDLDPLGGLQVTTVYGEVTLRLPAESDTKVHLHSISGDVRSEFEGLRRSSAPASHSVSGSLGAGSGLVSVTTMSGRVVLLRRAERDAAPGRAGADNEHEMEGESS
jgi:hypothetical protein